MWLLSAAALPAAALGHSHILSSTGYARELQAHACDCSKYKKGASPFHDGTLCVKLKKKGRAACKPEKADSSCGRPAW